MGTTEILFDIIVSFLVAVLSGMGIGSAGLLVIYLVRFAGINQITAQGINLLFYLFSAGASFGFHLKRRTFFPALILWLTVMAIPGVLLGSRLTFILPAKFLKKAFGAMLVLAGTVSLKRIFSNSSVKQTD